MKSLVAYFLATFVSLEFLVGAVAALAIAFLQDEVGSVSSRIPDNQELLKHLALLPSAVLAYSFAEARKLLLSPERSSPVLRDWPDYWKLKVHVKVAVLYAIGFAAEGLVAWSFGYQVYEPVGFVLVVSSIVGAVVVAFSVYTASIELDEILAGSPDEL